MGTIQEGIDIDLADLELMLEHQPIHHVVEDSRLIDLRDQGLDSVVVEVSLSLKPDITLADIEAWLLSKRKGV